MDVNIKKTKRRFTSPFFFALSSTSLIKEWSPNFESLMCIPKEERDEQFGIMRIGFFFTSLIECYIRFLSLRLRKLLRLTAYEAFYGRQTFVINTEFNHLLIVEWGLYNGEYLNGSSLFNTLSSKSSTFKRPHNLFEYETTRFDLLHPINKISASRVRYPSAIVDKAPHIGNRWFFNFFCLIPFVSSSPPVGAGYYGYNPSPIMSVLFPISFEFFLLRFNILAYLFSTSYSHIYEFYSLGFIEAIFIRIRCILDKVFIAIFDGVLGPRDFNSYDRATYILRNQAVATLFFYSFRKVRVRNVHRWVRLKAFLLYIVEHNCLYGLPMRFFFFLFSGLSLIIFIFGLYFYGVGVGQVGELSSSYIYFRSNLIGYLFYFYRFLFFGLVYFVLIYYFLAVWFHYGFTKRLFSSFSFYKKYSGRFMFKVHFVFYKLKQFFTKLVMGYIEILLPRLVALLLYFWGVALWLNNLEDIWLFCILTVIGLYFTFSLFSSFVNISYKLLKLVFVLLKYYIFGSKLKTLYLGYIDVFSTIENKTYPPSFFFVSIIILPIISFIVYTILSFCYFLRVCFPPTREKWRNRLNRNYNKRSYWETNEHLYSDTSFMVPFLNWKDYCDVSVELRPSVLNILSPEDWVSLTASFVSDNILSYLDFLIRFNYLESKFIRKFLLSRSRRLYQIDYCNFNFYVNNYGDYVGYAYTTREIQSLPSKFLYVLIIIDVFLIWFFLNFFLILKGYIIRLFCFFSTLLLSFFPTFFTFQHNGFYTINESKVRTIISYPWLHSFLIKFLDLFYFIFEELLFKPFIYFAEDYLTPNNLYCYARRDEAIPHVYYSESFNLNWFEFYVSNLTISNSNFKFMFYFVQENLFYTEWSSSVISLDLNSNIYNIKRNRYLLCPNDFHKSDFGYL